MSQHIGPRTISAIGGSIKRVGNYRIHTFPSELVTDGLVLNLDAADPRSYPGSGTTWTDLTGNGNTGTLTNGPTYNNANGGSIVFDGTNDYVALPSTNLAFGSNQFSIEAWVYATATVPSTNNIIYCSQSSNSAGFIGLVYNNTNGFLISDFNGSTRITASNSTPVSLNTWYHVVALRNSSNQYVVYVNGVASAPSSVSTLSLTAATPTIGYNPATATEIWTGRISNFRVYNRALSAAEVAQNYDALKVRYTSYTNTFTPLCGGGSGKVEVLCVAGGGGGSGGDVGSGGGAGGLIYNSAFTINSNSAISVTVGNGGASTGDYYTAGNDGQNSTFSTLTAIGGGGGGSWSAGNGLGRNGGSGGGGWVTPSSGTSGQGYAGGLGITGTNYPAGGGGGAGGIGMSAPSQLKAGDGGPGLQYSISGTPQFYAGGGGGSSEANSNGSSVALGLGGSGVGGTGGRQTSRIQATNAIPNTGSGGGGDDPGFGGNGSNGIIIVRYPASDYNIELLIVGGGGGGGNDVGGGGGAGGLLYYSSYPVSAGTKYSVTVGAGGSGGVSTFNVSGSFSVSGGNSIFGPLVSYGGGAGGNRRDGSVTGNLASSGGSGGGGSFGGFSGGSGTSGQGNAGGTGGTSTGPGGGGGGAGGVGAAGTSAGSAAGGIGLTYNITGTSVTYAVGGNGGPQSATQSGSSTAGSGGSGAGNNPLPASAPSGVSGTVIIAYKGPQRGIGGTVDTTSRPGYTLHRFTATGTDFFIP